MSMIFDPQQFKTLHKVRKTYFQNAQKTLVEKRDFLEKIEQSVKEAQQATLEFADFRKQEKNRLYQEESERCSLKLKNLSTVNHELQILKQRLLEYEQKEHLVQQELAAAQVDLETAREQMILAQRELSKYDELGLSVAKEQVKQFELGQEREFEDFQSRTDPLFGG